MLTALILFLKNNPKAKKIALGLLGLFLFPLTFAAGYFTHKPEVVTKVEIQYKDKIVEHTVYVKVKDTKRKTQKDVKIIKNKDGSEIITSHTTTGTETQEHDTTKDNKSETKSEEKKVTQTVNPGPTWMVGPQVGFNVHNLNFNGLKVSPGSLTVGGEVERKIVGPIWAGAYGQSSGEFGLTVKFAF